MRKLFLLLLILMSYQLVGCNSTFEEGDIHIISADTMLRVDDIFLYAGENGTYELQMDSEIDVVSVLATTSTSAIEVSEIGRGFLVTGLEDGSGYITLEIVADKYDEYSMTIPVTVQLQEQELWTLGESVVPVNSWSTLTVEDVESSDLYDSTKYILLKRLENEEELNGSDLVEDESITFISEEVIRVTVLQDALFHLEVQEDTILSLISDNPDIFTIVESDDGYMIRPLKAGVGTIQIIQERDYYYPLESTISVEVVDASTRIYTYEQDYSVEVGVTQIYDYIVYPEDAIVELQEGQEDLFVGEIEEEGILITGVAIGEGTVVLVAQVDEFSSTTLEVPLTVTPTKTLLQLSGERLSNEQIQTYISYSNKINIVKSEFSQVTYDYNESELEVVDQGTSVLVTPLKEGTFSFTIHAEEENYLDHSKEIKIVATKSPVDLQVSASSVTVVGGNASQLTVKSATEQAKIQISATDGIVATYSGNTISITATKSGQITIEASESNHLTTTVTIPITYTNPTVELKASTSVTVSGTNQATTQITVEDGANVALSTTGGVSATYNASTKVITIAATSSGSVVVSATKSGYNSATATINVSYSTPATYDNYATQVVALVNEQRTAAGLGSLTISSGLMTGAQIRAEEIVSVFSHTRPNGTSCFTVSSEASGENLAYGQSSPSVVMASWMGSQGHKDNILKASFTKIGVGVYQSNGRYYWVQLFGY